MGTKKKRRGLRSSSRERPKKRPEFDPDDRVTLEHTELRNAEKLLRLKGHDLRYVGAWDTWLVWDGSRWKLDEDGAAMRFAKESAQAMAAEAEALLKQAREVHEEEEEADRKEKLALNTRGKAHASMEAMIALKHATAAKKWCESSQNNARLKATLEIASSDAEVAVSHQGLDANHWLFNVENGTVNLKTGQLQPHSREDLVTKIAPVVFDASAKCPRWRKFVRRAMGKDKKLVRYLQRFVGYALTGETRAHALVFFHGEGNNGKSTFLNTLYKLFGDYAMRASRGLLFKSRNEKHPTHLASLHGKRFVTCAEIEEDQEFDEALTKDLTGGDPINARRMREDEWEFNPTHKLFLAGNHKPRIKGTDKGIWRRMNLVPWSVTISDAKVDQKLPRRLEAEFSGILNWCIEGCLAWQQRGLDPPQSVLVATAEYKKEQDVLGQFFSERLVFGQDERVGRTDLRAAYERWCEELGHMAVGARKLAQALRERKHRDVNGETVHVADGWIWDKSKGQSVDGWTGVRLSTKKDRAKKKFKENTDHVTEKTAKMLRKMAERENGANDAQNRTNGRPKRAKTPNSGFSSPDVPMKSRGDVSRKQPSS
jgi:putative DNA primase/helicase